MYRLIGFFFRNPCCLSKRILLASRWFNRCFEIMCSISLLHTHVSDTGRQFDGQYRSPFLKIGTIFACFQSSGTSPFSRDLENSICRIGAATLAVSLRTLG